MEMHKSVVAARFVTTARFVTKVLKLAAMPARFVTNEVVTNLYIAHKKKTYSQNLACSQRKIRTVHTLSLIHI